MDGFKKVDGTPIRDLKNYCLSYIESHPKVQIFVGADAKEYTRSLSYSNPIVFYRPGKGGHVIVRREKTNLTKRADMFSKLWREVELVGEVCVYLRDEVGIDSDRISAHLDYNSNDVHASSKLKDAGIGYLKGLGFKNISIKPYAWASNSVGDSLC